MSEKTDTVKTETQTESYPGVRLRIFMGGTHHDEIFISEKVGAVPPEVQEFVEMFQMMSDKVWAPNSSKLRGYMIKNLSGYQIDQVTVHSKPVSEKANDTKKSE